MTQPLFLACAAAAICSYLLGSINWSVIISRVFYHKDIREFGSGNAGMTNMLRTFGKAPAAAVALGDFGKSILAVAVSRAVIGAAFGPLPFDVGYVAGICAVLGHLFPVYFRFKGGKGVLTSLGMVVVIDWRSFLIVLGLGLVILFCSRIVSLASVLGAVLYPAVTYGVQRWRGRVSAVDLTCALLLALLVIYMHRANIKRLLSGTEYRFGKTKKDPSP